MDKPTKKAAEFMAANKESFVVSGAAFAKGGGNYTLANGRSFDLSLDDMRSMPMPDWGFDDAKLVGPCGLLAMAINPTESFTGIPMAATLDEIAQLVTKCDFADITAPEHRAVVVDLAIKAEQSGALQDMALWFRVSKVWEGN